jgi:xanthosine utilization system XapX-like protein
MPMTAMITVGMVGAHVMVPSPTPPDRAAWPLVPPA